jgi:hypothetical protein
MHVRRVVQSLGKILLSIMFVILSQAAAVAQSQTPGSDACAGPTKDVIMMSLQDPDNEQAYLIIVKNRSRHPIVALTVGDGSKPQLHTVGFAVPLQILGPSGWTATHVFKEESMFMHWVWTVKKTEAVIAPGEMASGFKVTLPPFPSSARGKEYPDGAPIQPIKVSDLPFRVQFENGACVWGHIRSLITMASGK